MLKKQFINRYLDLVGSQLLSILFLAGLAGMIFLGDGKQGFVEVVSSGFLVVLYTFTYLRMKKVRVVPRSISTAWFLLIGYYCVRSLWSDSLAYSISSTIRLMQGYVVFVLFYEFATKKTIEFFLKGLLVLSSIAIAASLYFIVMPYTWRFLPLMNLLYANFGHNHLPVLLIFIYPYVLIKVLERSNRMWSIFYGFLILALIVSFSRGAALLYGVYTLIHAGWYTCHVSKRSKESTLITFLGVILTSSLIVYSGLTLYYRAEKAANPDAIRLSPLYHWFERQTNKPLLVEDGRWNYWNQAVKAIQDRPLFGSGPGTFYLASKRFQEKPNEYSWFAHNSVLQTWAEVGLVGIILAANVLITIGATIHRHSSLYIHSIFHGSPAIRSLWISVVLTGMFSLFDFNLDFLVIWLLLWSIISLVIGVSESKVGIVHTS